MILVDVRLIKDTYVYNEFDEVENTYWFDFKQKKFLHNIDTFYYAVKFKQDFTADSKDMKVKDFRRKFEALSREWDNQNAFNSSISFFVPGMPDALNYTPFSYAFFYNVKLECPELFDIFLLRRFRTRLITESLTLVSVLCRSAAICSGCMVLNLLTSGHMSMCRL